MSVIDRRKKFLTAEYQEIANSIHHEVMSIFRNKTDDEIDSSISSLSCQVAESMMLGDIGKNILKAHDLQGSLVQLYGTEAMMTGRTAMKAGQIFSKLKEHDDLCNEAVNVWNKYLEAVNAEEAT